MGWAVPLRSSSIRDESGSLEVFRRRRSGPISRPHYRSVFDCISKLSLGISDVFLLTRLGSLCNQLQFSNHVIRFRTSLRRAHRASLERLSSSWRSSLVESGHPGFTSPGTLRPCAFSHFDALLLDRACSTCFIRAPPSGFKEQGGLASFPRRRPVTTVSGFDRLRID